MNEWGVGCDVEKKIPVFETPEGRALFSATDRFVGVGDRVILDVVLYPEHCEVCFAERVVGDLDWREGGLSSVLFNDARVRKNGVSWVLQSCCVKLLEVVGEEGIVIIDEQDVFPAHELEAEVSTLGGPPSGRAADEAILGAEKLRGAGVCCGVRMI